MTIEVPLWRYHELKYSSVSCFLTQLTWTINNNIKEALKTTSAVKDTSMTLPRKLPNFPQQIIESERKLEDDNLHSAEP